jgi:hypothetical protein
VTCTCGETAPHVVARRTTSDGVPAELYSDGYVCGPVGTYLPGVGRRRLPASRVWAFAAEVCLFAAAELGALVAEHQAAVKAALAARPMHPDALRGPSLYPSPRRR